MNKNLLQGRTEGAQWFEEKEGGRRQSGRSMKKSACLLALMLPVSGGLMVPSRPCSKATGLARLGAGTLGRLNQRRPACCMANEPDRGRSSPPRKRDRLLRWVRGDPLPPEGRGAPVPAAASPQRVRKRDRLLNWLRGEVGAQEQEDADAAGTLPLSVLAASAAAHYEDMPPLSTLVFDAIAALPKGQKLSGSLALRVGSKSQWRVFACEDGVMTTTCLDKDVEVIGAGCDAAVEWRDEQVFEAIMDERLSTAAAVALAKLRVRGSVSIAASSEDLFEKAETVLRARLEGAVDVGGDASVAAASVEEARRAAFEREGEERLLRVSTRSVIERFVLRHAGTDQQLAAVLLVVGGALYAFYCAAALQYADQAQAATIASGQLYLISSTLWLAGSFALVYGCVCLCDICSSTLMALVCNGSVTALMSHDICRSCAHGCVFRLEFIMKTHTYTYMWLQSCPVSNIGRRHPAPLTNTSRPEHLNDE